MAQHTQEILRFHPVNGKTVRADLNGGELSSDFGALLLREAAIRSWLIPRLAKAIQDKRHQSYVDHPIQDLLMQRVLQMACGYQDANDSNHLRKDPMFKLAVGRSPLNAEAHLASAPTFTRFGQGLSRRDIYNLAYSFAEHCLNSYKKPPKLAVLDLDHTATLTHGAQQYSLFNTKYGNTCYFPLMTFEGLCGKLITAIKLPNAELITWFGENCIDLKQQTNSGHGQRVSDREKKSEITAKETLPSLRKRIGLQLPDNP